MELLLCLFYHICNYILAQLEPIYLIPSSQKEQNTTFPIKLLDLSSPLNECFSAPCTLLNKGRHLRALGLQPTDLEMSFTVCSPGCCLLRGPILLLSDKAALLFSLPNPLFIGKNRPKPSSLPPRLPRSPDVTPSSILFLRRSFQHFQPSPASFLCSCHFLLSWKKTPLYFIDFFFFFSLFMRVCILLFLARTRCGSPHSSSSSSSSSSLLPSLHRSCAVAFELKCCKSVIRI